MGASSPATTSTTTPQWHTRGGTGGTKTRANETSLADLGLEEVLALRASVQRVLGAHHPGTTLLNASIERAAVLKRGWTDEEFQDGEEGNAARVATLEDTFRNAHSSSSGLNDPATLGMALDLVGVYLKNYRVAKASAVMEEALPICRRKGGVWLIKALNHASTVRMKQQRHAEALVMLRELETLIHFEPEEAAELYDMLYRNIGMALQALGRSADALPYFLRCAKVKGVATWWDRWDVGYCMATLAFEGSDSTLVRRAAAAIHSAIPLHAEAEPGEHVMHAKILQALADCYLALATMEDNTKVGGEVASTVAEAAAIMPVAGDCPVERELSKAEYLELAEEGYVAAHRLFTEACGESNDLSGWCAAAVALTMVQRERHEAAFPYLQHALFVSGCSDIPKMSQLRTNIELLTQCHNLVQKPALMTPILPHLDAILKRLPADAEGDVARIRRSIAVLFATREETDYQTRGLEMLSTLL